MSSAVSTTSRMRMRPRRGFGVVGLAARRVREAERELLPGRRDRGRRNDARSEMMAICEHTEVSRHVKTRRRDEGAQPGEELVLAHVGSGGAAAPGGQRRVEVQVVVLGDGCGGPVDLREYGRHPPSLRCGCGQEVNSKAPSVARQWRWTYRPRSLRNR